MFPSYAEFARQLYGTGILSDPWLEGEERFRLQGVVLTSRLAAALRTVAERVCYLHNELAGIVHRNPDLIDRFFHLTPWQKAMWMVSDGRWHGIARVDLFLCTDGRIRSCEVNSDTPSGEAEAVLLNRLLHPYHPGTIDPNEDFDEQFWGMLLASHQARTGKSAPPEVAAILYPTDLPEDLSMIAIYRQWLEARGVSVILGSPYNLGRGSGGDLTVLGEPVDLIVRHYKTDWWGEREVIWNNEPPYPDPDPLDRELEILLEAELAGRVTVVNPFGSVITQNKKSLAFMWEHRDLFSAQSQDWIAAYIPETRRLTSLDSSSLSRKEWVLKSDYGCEGDSVICGPFVRLKDWRLTLSTAIPDRWVAQRFFEVAAIDEGFLPNFGVYVLGGKARGFYTRLSKQATDYTSVTAPTYVNE
ncbi:MAG: glutathionylspermidine synthase family protein [Acidobacteria bacterium]|nr:glutathionylspermidine synthase family protein [Acidobacteriota bacterium]